MSKSGLLSELLIGLLESDKSSSDLPGRPLVLQGKSSVLQGRWLVVGKLLQGRLFVLIFPPD
jgi:hypothetical protein